jgi:hypothetical protein
MTLTSISYEIRGTAPRTRYDVLHTEEDTEGFTGRLGGSFDVEYDEYACGSTLSGNTSGLLS